MTWHRLNQGTNDGHGAVGRWGIDVPDGLADRLLPSLVSFNQNAVAKSVSLVWKP